MCLACEQDAMWFAYLRRRGLIDENGEPVEPVPSLADPFDALAMREELAMPDEKEAKVEPSAAKPADKGVPSRDEPTAE